mmetsp:Transcript_2736/g.4433  ORF Transcript_2736/g.4433 Transcript_2736/m.4433 type:complete len:86 (-) Transcript_2736:521-778(-)
MGSLEQVSRQGHETGPPSLSPQPIFIAQSQTTGPGMRARFTEMSRIVKALFCLLLQLASSSSVQQVPFSDALVAAVGPECLQLTT